MYAVSSVCEVVVCGPGASVKSNPVAVGWRLSSRSGTD